MRTKEFYYHHTIHRIEMGKAKLGTKQTQNKEKEKLGRFSYHSNQILWGQKDSNI